MGPVLLAIGLVAYNSLANRWKPFHSWAYVPANVTLAGGVLAIGVWGFDLSRAALGLRWSDAWIGAALGAGGGSLALALLAFERGRALLRDQRLAGIEGWNAAYMVLVRIPIGTALVEEVVFRGVLLGAWLHLGTAEAVIASSIPFGLWHIVPTAILARENRLRAAVVPGGVVLTTGVGVLLGWLRVETGSLATPFLIHALFNSLSAAAALVVLKRTEPASSTGP